MSAAFHPPGIRIALAAVVAVAVLASPAARADDAVVTTPLAPSQVRAEEVSLEAVAGAILTSQEAAGLLLLPYPDGWTSSMLTAGRTGGHVDGSVVLTHRRSTSLYETFFPRIEMCGTTNTAARKWADMNDVSAKAADARVLTDRRDRFAVYREPKPRSRSVTASLLLGSWASYGGCFTNDPKVSVGELSTCAWRLAKGQRWKAARTLSLT